MDNPRKRPLQSSSLSSSNNSNTNNNNKYSNGNTKKIKSNGKKSTKSSKFCSKLRAPQPTSVAKLESLLKNVLSEGETKTKTKKTINKKSDTTKNDGVIRKNDTTGKKRKQNSSIVSVVNPSSSSSSNNDYVYSSSRTTADMMDRWSYLNGSNKNKNTHNHLGRIPRHLCLFDDDAKGGNNKFFCTESDGQNVNNKNDNTDNKKKSTNLNEGTSTENDRQKTKEANRKMLKRKKVVEENSIRKHHIISSKHVVDRTCSNSKRRSNNNFSSRTAKSSTLTDNDNDNDNYILTVSSTTIEDTAGTTTKSKNSISCNSHDDHCNNVEPSSSLSVAQNICDAGTRPSCIASSNKNDTRINSTAGRSSSSSFPNTKLSLRLSNINNKARTNKKFSSLLLSRQRTTSSTPSVSSTNADTGDISKEREKEDRHDELLILPLPSKSSLGSSSSSSQYNNTNTSAYTTNALSSDYHPNQISVAKATGCDNRTDDSISVVDENEKRTTTNFRSIESSKNATTSKYNATTSKKKGKFRGNNDNFVRLNLKNNAGACRGARNKKSSKERRSWSFRGRDDDRKLDKSYDDDDDANHYGTNDTTTFRMSFDPSVPSKYSPKSSMTSNTNDADVNDSRGTDGSRKRNNFNRNSGFKEKQAASYASKMSGLDPMDEFIDGSFHPTKAINRIAAKGKGSSDKNGNDDATVCSSTTSKAAKEQEEAPKCARHQLSCKLIKVKKNTTGNKGRMFYACSMPRGEQCDHFQWADDTIEAAQVTLSENSSFSRFITRQVAAYVDRFRTLTVPELKNENARRGLNKNGKKQQLLSRLAIWTRDELVKGSPEYAKEIAKEGNEQHSIGKYTHDTIRSDIDITANNSVEENSEDDGYCSSTSGEDSSGDELEICCGDNTETLQSTLFKKDSHSNQSHPVLIGTSGDTNLLSESLQNIFGHTSFRNGQEWAIQRCLEQKRSLLVAPTGFGKSLCYALPAALMDGVCVVVSPLISLIQDQLRSLPPRIPAATLSGSVSSSKMAAILDDIVRKRLKILFVSPERLTSPAFRRLFNPIWNPETKTKERKFPEISLLCVDEAHCISQWAHNFRPCFLRFKGFLKLMKPKSILAITATAGPKVIMDIGQTLDIEIPLESISRNDNGESFKIIRTGRDNIDVLCSFMSNHEERLAVLSGILTPTKVAMKNGRAKQPYAGKLSKGSVIVYVWRQKDTEVVAENLVAAGVSGGVVVYHGGMNANARAKSQSRFMRGKARIVVATVAFGLGIDKADIIGVVHLYLSNSPEHYMQEIGRAGRDGRPATAIALPLLEEVPIRHSLVHSNSVAKSQIRSLFQSIRRLVKSTGNTTGRITHIALPVYSVVRDCDCKPEMIETFLSLIERLGGDHPLLLVEGYNYDNATVALKKRTLQKLADKEPVAASIQEVSDCIDAPLCEVGDTKTFQKQVISNTFQRQFLAYSMGSYSFSISKCAYKLGELAEPRHVFAALRRLQSSNELEFALDTTDKGRVFHLRISEKGVDFFNQNSHQNEDDLVSNIYESFTSSSTSCAAKVLDMHYILDEVANSSGLSNDCEEDIPKSQSLLRFQELIQSYFKEGGIETERLSKASELLPKSFFAIKEKELKIDALSILRDLPSLFQNGGDNSSEVIRSEQVILGDPALTDYTALAITKFLHGHDTPRTPMLTFRRYPLFGKWKVVDFESIHEKIIKILRTMNTKHVT